MIDFDVIFQIQSLEFTKSRTLELFRKKTAKKKSFSTKNWFVCLTRRIISGLFIVSAQRLGKLPASGPDKRNILVKFSSTYSKNKKKKTYSSQVKSIVLMVFMFERVWRPHEIQSFMFFGKQGESFPRWLRAAASLTDGFMRGYHRPESIKLD